MGQTAPPIRPLDLWRALVWPALASLGAGAVLFALRNGLDLDAGPVPALGAGFVVFGMLYALPWLTIPSGRSVLRGFRPLLDDIVPGRHR